MTAAGAWLKLPLSQSSAAGVMSSKPTSFKSPEMAKKFPLNPKHPERTCWGCDRYCPSTDLQCGNGSGRTQHPAELLGDDWYTWGDWGIDVSNDEVKE
jgi:hypothetical protein